MRIETQYSRIKIIRRQLVKLRRLCLFLAIALIVREVFLQWPKVAKAEFEGKVSLSVTNWGHVLYDSMPAGTDHGTTFIKVEYPYEYSERKEVVSIRVKGTVTFHDGFVEKIDGPCLRRGSASLNKVARILREEKEGAHLSPVCFMELNHRILYDRKPRSEWKAGDGPHTALDDDTRYEALSAVVTPKRVKLEPIVLVAFKPTKLQIEIEDWLSRK